MKAFLIDYMLTQFPFLSDLIFSLENLACRAGQSMLQRSFFFSIFFSFDGFFDFFFDDVLDDFLFDFEAVSRHGEGVPYGCASVPDDFQNVFSAVGGVTSVSCSLAVFVCLNNVVVETECRCTSATSVFGAVSPFGSETVASDHTSVLDHAGSVLT